MDKFGIYPCCCSSYVLINTGEKPFRCDHCNISNGRGFFFQRYLLMGDVIDYLSWLVLPYMRTNTGQ